MRGKKLAFIITTQKPTEHYLQLHNGVFESIKYLTKNFETRVYCLTEQMNVLQRPTYDLYFRNTFPALKFALNESFEPTHVFFISEGDFDFDLIPLNKGVPKFLIHKGRKHLEKYHDYFETVIVETEDEVKHYKKAMTQNVVNTNIYYPQITEKYFTFCFPQELQPSKFEFFNKVRVYGSISQNLNSTVKLPLNNSQILSVIFNQSKAVALIDDTEDALELALSALACNVPVITTNDSKATTLPAVVKADTQHQDFINKMYQTMQVHEQNINFRDEYVMHNFTPQRYAKILMDLIV